MDVHHPLVGLIDALRADGHLYRLPGPVAAKEIQMGGHCVVGVRAVAVVRLLGPVQAQPQSDVLPMRGKPLLHGVVEQRAIALHQETIGLRPPRPVLGQEPLDHLADSVEFQQRLPAEEVYPEVVEAVLGEHPFADLVLDEGRRKRLPALVLVLFVTVDAIEIAGLGQEEDQLAHRELIEVTFRHLRRFRCFSYNTVPAFQQATLAGFTQVMWHGPPHSSRRKWASWSRQRMPAAEK